jgi:hypothetical protein
MNDSGKILIGIGVFVALITFPIWFSVARGGSGATSDHELPDASKLAGEEWKAERCIAPRDEMAARHMEILNDWRDSVVREGHRVVEIEGLPGPIDGKWEMSLSRTCLDCHTSKSAFCDRCHDYADVRPYCWDCHVVPEGRD